MALVESLRGTRALPPREPPPGLCADLRPYQLDGWRWLRLLSDSGLGGVLADDMGLGKTLQALTLLLSLKAEAGGAALVVAPTSVLRNWESEAARFSPELRTAVLHGPRRDAGLQRLRGGEIDLAVTSYALLRRDVEDLQGVEFGTVILDEAQQIKNPDSQTAKAARSLHARRRFALTGTPIENHLSELWSQFEFLMPGFFGSRTRFEERLGIPAARGDEKALRALRDRVRPFVLRRMKEQVAKDLPPRTETILRCPLTDAQRAAYEAVRAAALKGLQVPGTKGESSGAGSVAGSVDGKQKAGSRRMAILAALLRLRQAACHAALVPGGSADDPSGKLDLLLETLTDLADEGHRALVFSQWTSLLDLVEPRLAAANLGFLRLDGSTRDRAGVVAQFQDKDGPPVFLVSLKAGGTGLNLVAADHVIHLDPWWNPAVEQQATDRAHRIGQDKPVFVWKLVSEGTVEERVLALQERKKAVAASVLADAAGIDDLGEEELLQLLESAAD
jgi:SNF2 family DNA or RNA helicase